MAGPSIGKKCCNMPYGAICHIEKVYINRKQDSLIFVDFNTHNALLEDLQTLVPDMFRSDCPVFMPRGYLNLVKQRLDNNVIFYENLNGTYNLTDIYSVNGGPTISLPLASWDHRNHVQLQMGLNRWDRRTDLRGAKFVNTLWFNGQMAYFIYDIDGKIKIQYDKRDEWGNGTIIVILHNILAVTHSNLNFTEWMRNCISCNRALELS